MTPEQNTLVIMLNSKQTERLFGELHCLLFALEDMGYTPEDFEMNDSHPDPETSDSHLESFGELRNAIKSLRSLQRKLLETVRS